jgi:hypothetical protein
MLNPFEIPLIAKYHNVWGYVCVVVTEKHPPKGPASRLLDRLEDVFDHRYQFREALLSKLVKWCVREMPEI